MLIKIYSKELLSVSGADQNKKYALKLKKYRWFSKTELNFKKKNTYLFDGKKLTLYDIPSDNITLLAFENKFMLKNKN